MSRRTISIINCVLSSIIFLVFFGAFSSNINTKDERLFKELLYLTLYFGGYVLISIYCIVVAPDSTSTPFKFAAIYTILYTVLIIILCIATLFIDDFTISDNIESYFIVSWILPPIISGLYFRAIFIKE